MLRFPKTKRKSRSSEQTRLDTWFNRFIRVRDTGADGLCRCITCNKRLPPAQMHCGHFVTRDHWSVRFNKQNCNAQCYDCNSVFGGQQGRHALEIDRLYGTGTAQMLLDIGTRTGMLKAWECGVQADEYKRRTMELLKRKGMSKWW